MIEAERNTWTHVNFIELNAKILGEIITLDIKFLRIGENIFNIIGTLKLKLKSWLSEEC